MTIWQGEYSNLFIGGRWVDPASSATIEVVSPFTEQRLAEVPAGSPEDIDRAVAAAREAFDRGPWPRMSLAERMDIVRRLGEEFDRHGEKLAAVITEEMGSPITLSRWYQVGWAKRWVESFLEVARRFPFEEVRRSPIGDALVVREPVGVVAAIIPWNAPQVVAMLKLAPAMLAGCTTVLKPAPEAPLDSYLLAEMLVAAGVPDGVVNIVPAHRDASEHLVIHTGVDKVSFTGSTAAGQRIAALCGRDVRRVTLELGGKSAAIVLDDADLDSVTEALRLGSFRNTGQICTLKTRVLVSRSREEELVERLVSMVSSMPIGDPTDPATELGPLVSARQRERVEGYIESGKAEGARLVVGGRRPPGLKRGWFVEATIFSGVTPDMRIAREEIFGPVLCVMTYEDEDDAIAIANNSEYGLSGAVFTSDLEHGLELSRKLRTGVVELNASPLPPYAPIGGFKLSGLGREAGPEGLDGYTECRSIALPPGLGEQLSEALPSLHFGIDFQEESH
ncbi:MAG: aldehyde dehydrogenase [Thermomicrobium sp.]|nr:aldehyde dehydrogenase [Thermomicrobium sp.]